MKNGLFFLFSHLVSVTFLQAQKAAESDTLSIKFLPEITLVGRANRSDLQQIPEIVGTTIYAGKKSNLLVLKNTPGNITTNVMRQVMAKIPGIHIWENDGSGIQIGVATRGLSPNRSWEFNVRQNGYDISADPYGYPEAYYNPQLQAVQRIEVVRGHGALQYGPQFGGMINYILRDGSECKKAIQLETQQTIGSYGLTNQYIGAGGQLKKWTYFAFVDHRKADGYRENSSYGTKAGFATLTFRPNPKFSTQIEVMLSDILSQQPGGLTDAALQLNNRQSWRHRNWIGIQWSTAAWRNRWEISESSRMELKLFGMVGNRISVGFLPSGGIVIPDTIQTLSNTYAPRTNNIDQYRNAGIEWRWITDYKIKQLKSTVAVGIRQFLGQTNRRIADSNGELSANYTISIKDNRWVRDIDFSSGNQALFAENIFRIGSRLLLIPGFRYEWIQGKAKGQYNWVTGNPLYLQTQQKNRKFLLVGFGTEYHVTTNAEIYANITEAYRPILFSDLSTPPGSDQIDPAIRDAKGYNADIGWRGKLSKLLYGDISLYYLYYGNRVGTILQENIQGERINWRTNIGTSTAKGIELYLAFQPIFQIGTKNKWQWSQYVAYAFNDARYTSLQVSRVINNQVVQTNLKNNQVENAPRHTFRTGITLQYKEIKLTSQWSYTDGTFSDANNTVIPTANAQNGWIPSYRIMDAHLTIPVDKTWSIAMGINNLLNTVYFTRRASGYPGPGAMPAEGRTVFFTIKNQF